MVLTRLPFVQGILRNPHADQQLSPHRTVDLVYAVDPVTETPLTHSLPASSSRLSASSPVFAVSRCRVDRVTRLIIIQEMPHDDTFDIFNDLFNVDPSAMPSHVDPMMSLWGGTDNSFFPIGGSEALSSSDIDLWNALVPPDGTGSFSGTVEEDITGKQDGPRT